MRIGGKDIVSVLFVESILEQSRLHLILKIVLNVEAEANTLVVSTESDLRAEISKAVVGNDVPLIQVKIQEFSLDEIYMKYFSEG